MIELQVLNKLINDGNLSFLIEYGIDKSYFSDFKNEYAFIIDHFDKYARTPDSQTMLNTFSDFQVFTVNESDEYLANKLKEQRLYKGVVGKLHIFAEKLELDSFDAVSYLKNVLDDLTQQESTSGIDITKDTSRLTAVKDKLEGKADIIKTGLKELDDAIYGWLPGEELVAIVARTGNGKTWFLLWLLVAAWKQGKRVGIYSGEMSADRIGYRVDTLIEHFSNRDLVRGSIGDIDEYEAYLDSLKSTDVPFYVITRKDLGGRATVSNLVRFAKVNKLDILGVDQYTLMDDERMSRTSSTREQLEHISSDLFNASCELQIPIIALTQSNRAGAKNEDKSGTPDVENIYGADAIGQNSTKVITIRQTGAGMELSIKKNRDDEVGKTLMFYWDIDNGIMKYIPSSNDNTASEEVRNKFNDERDVF